MTTAPHQHFAPVSAPADDELQLLDAYTHGMDAPEINNWRWTFGHGACNG
jgi:hypothetical protein